MMPLKEYSSRKKLKAEEWLAAKKNEGVIAPTGEDDIASARDKDLRQDHEKTALLRLADQFFAFGARSLEQVAYDEAKEYIISIPPLQRCRLIVIQKGKKPPR
jgi:hypothetical protein